MTNLLYQGTFTGFSGASQHLLSQDGDIVAEIQAVTWKGDPFNNVYVGSLVVMNAFEELVKESYNLVIIVYGESGTMKIKLEGITFIESGAKDVEKAHQFTLKKVVL
ncbi:hypothetical protein_gp035 [Bacillus phage vB_BceM_WH1]|nr:hypothetical protein_gp035 [Bacillus phage vB_BceM_WH1]